VCSEKVTILNVKDKRIAKNNSDEKNSSIFNQWIYSNSGGKSSAPSPSETSSTVLAAVRESKRFYDVYPSLILIVFVIRQNIPDEILFSDGFLKDVVTSW